jgi:hypothetical protein
MGDCPSWEGGTRCSVGTAVRTRWESGEASLKKAGSDSRSGPDAAPTRALARDSSTCRRRRKPPPPSPPSPPMVLLPRETRGMSRRYRRDMFLRELFPNLWLIRWIMLPYFFGRNGQSRSSTGR